MPEKTRQHTVPQFYLRNFAREDRPRATRLFRIATREHVESASIRRQCYRKHFYGTEPTIEDALGAMETMASASIRRMLHSQRVPPPYSEELEHLLAFVVLQEARTVAASERENASLTRFSRAVLSADPSIPDEAREHLGDMRVKHDAIPLFSLQASAQCLPLVHDLRLKLLRNDTPIEFVTSDAPAVLHNHWARRCVGFGCLGFTCSGLQIFCPLSPRFLAVLYDTDVYSVGESSEDVVGITDLNEIRSLNLLQVASAMQSLYYSSENMVAEIDDLPMTSRRPIEEQVDVSSFREEDGESHLIAFLRPLPRVTLNVRTIQVRDAARAVPHWQRGREYRPEARAIAEHLFPDRPRGQDNPEGPVQRYVRCD